MEDKNKQFWIVVDDGYKILSAIMHSNINKQALFNKIRKMVKYFSCSI